MSTLEGIGSDDDDALLGEDEDGKEAAEVKHRCRRRRCRRGVTRSDDDDISASLFGHLAALGVHPRPLVDGAESADDAAETARIVLGLLSVSKD